MTAPVRRLFSICFSISVDFCTVAITTHRTLASSCFNASISSHIHFRDNDVRDQHKTLCIVMLRNIPSPSFLSYILYVPPAMAPRIPSASLLEGAGPRHADATTFAGCFHAPRNQQAIATFLPALAVGVHLRNQTVESNIMRRIINCELTTRVARWYNEHNRHQLGHVGQPRIDCFSLLFWDDWKGFRFGIIHWLA